MLKVVIRFDSKDTQKTIRMEGYTKNYPEIGKEFDVTVQQQGKNIIVDLGTVFNIESFGDMLLIQTQHLVAEVWIISGEGEQEVGVVLPFVNNYNTLFMKGGKITCLGREGAYSRAESLNKVQNLIKDFAEMNRVSAPLRTKPNLILIKGELHD